MNIQYHILLTKGLNGECHNSIGGTIELFFLFFLFVLSFIYVRTKEVGDALSKGILRTNLLVEHAYSSLLRNCMTYIWGQKKFLIEWHNFLVGMAKAASVVSKPQAISKNVYFSLAIAFFLLHLLFKFIFYFAFLFWSE